MAESRRAPSAEGLRDLRPRSAHPIGKTEDHGIGGAVTTPTLRSADRAARVASLLALQRFAGNRAVSRAVVAQPPKPRPTPAESTKLIALTDELIDHVRGHEDEKALDVIRFNVYRKEEMAAHYKRMTGSTLRSELITHLAVDTPLAKALAHLYYGGDIDHLAARMGVALIKQRVQDDEAMRLLTDHKLPERKALAKEYEQIYSGVLGAQTLVLLGHLDRLKGLTYDAVQKAMILVERDMTPADELYLALKWLTGAKADAINIIQAAWAKGVSGFQALIDDWNRYVRGVRAGVNQDVRDYAKAMLSGENRKLAVAVFEGFWWATSGIVSEEDAGVKVAEDSMAAAKGAWFGFGDAAQITKAAGAMRDAAARLEEREKWTGKKAKGAAEARGEAEKAVGGASGDASADQAEALIALRRKPTPADQVYVALGRGDEAAILKILIKAWNDGTELDIPAELATPAPGRGVRHLLFDVAKNWSGAAQKQARALLNPGFSHPMRAAVALRAMLEGDATSTASSDLKTAYRFLNDMSDGDRTAVLASYASVHLFATKGATPAEKFAHHIKWAKEFNFEASVTLVDLLRLLDARTDTPRRGQWANTRKFADDLGRGPVVDAIVRVYDRVSGEDTRLLADQALARLHDHIRMAKCRPDELKAVMAEEGLTDASDLGKFESR